MAGLTHPDGGTTAFLGDLLQHPEHVILLGGKSHAAADALSGHLGDLGTVTSVVAAAAEPRGGAIVDAAGEFGKRYGTDDNGTVVVRPDGSIGMIAYPPDNDASTAYRATLSLSTG